jgi:hypothetical protein
MLLDGVGHDFSIGGKGPDGPDFILLHEAAVTFYVCTENGCKLTFDLWIGHEIHSLRVLKSKERNTEENVNPFPIVTGFRVKPGMTTEAN